LREYVSCFNEDILYIEEVNEKVILAFFLRLWPFKFLLLLSKAPSNSKFELMLRVLKHMNIEDIMNAQRNQDQGEGN
jgi:hypothetical protein